MAKRTGYQRTTRGRISNAEKERRTRTIETFNEHGYDFINEDNYDYLIEFLEDARQRNLAALYGSEAIVEVFDKIRKRPELTKEQILGNIKYWEEHADKKIRLDKRRYSSSDEFYN